MTVDDYDRWMAGVFLLYALVVAAALGIRILATFLAQRLAPNAEPTTEAPGSGDVASSAVVASDAIGISPATEDSGGEVTAAPASGESTKVQLWADADHRYSPRNRVGPRDDPASSVASGSKL